MRVLTYLELVVGAFIVLFFMWQIIIPLLRGQLPFPAFREEAKKTTEGVEQPTVQDGKEVK